MAAPVKNTCPDIDRGIKALKQAMSEIRDGIEDKQAVRSIEIEIDTAIAYFEEVRSANESLRSWGKELEDEIESSANYINDLEEKVASLEKDLANQTINS